MEVALQRPSAPRFSIWVVVVTKVWFLVIIMTLSRVATLALRHLHLSARLFSVFVVLLLAAVGVKVIAGWAGRCAIAIAHGK